MAALTHDDIIDKADLRRGMMSLNALWGDRTAVLSGDYLVARSIRLFAGSAPCGLIDSIFQSVQYMTEGELTSLARKDNQPTEADCIQLAEQKTASYFAAICTAPTYIIGGQWREPLHAYGLAFGIAFQIIDDILDLTQDQAILGKPSCGDIAEGKKTLPVLYMEAALPESERAHLEQLMGRALTDEDREWVARSLDTSGARARTEALARKYADDALNALAPLPSNDFILVRGS
jgi:octaprenyl-diphosphate synthase